MTIFSGCFAIIGVLMTSNGDIVGLLCGIFFGLCAVIGAISLMRAGALELDKDGFAYTPLLGGSRKFRWIEVKDFGVYRVRRAKFVAFNEENPWHYRLAGVNTALTGRNAALPDTYGLPAEELARLMNSWRKLAVDR